MKFSSISREDFEKQMANLEPDEEANREIQNFVGKIDPNQKDSMVPPKAKKGELLICQFCGNPIYPKELQKEVEKRKLELKWHYHWKCRGNILETLDTSTAGLLAERRMFEKRRKIEEEEEARRYAKPEKRKSLLDLK